MLILGDKDVPCEWFSHITAKEQIEKTKSNSTLVLNYNKELCSYLNENNLGYAVIISSIKEAVYSNALNAKYLLVGKKNVKKIQDCAEHYMFDSKVLTVINSEDELEEIAILGIDGVIFNNLIQKD